MGIVLTGDGQYPAASVSCFLCGEPAGDGEPVVYWRGAGADLWLHGGCAGSFVLRLARDAWEIERDAGDGKFALTLRQPGVRVDMGRTT